MMKLSAEKITRNYFRQGKGTNFFTAVAPVDFTLEEGKLTELVGRSGSGKTTFINMLAGLLTPTEGRVLLDGRDLYAMDDNERSAVRSGSIGVIPQGQTGLQGLTVLENVLIPSAMYGGSKTKTELAHKLLEKMGIDDLCDVYSNELSGGELRRMAIARALINEPKIIIADEPTADLDDDTTKQVMELFKSKATEGCSVLIVTHERESMKYADLIYKMENGKLPKE